MMYLVTFTLNPPRPIPPKFLEALQGTNEWWHYLDTTWLLSTSESQDALGRRIIPPLTKDDRILIVPIPPNVTLTGWLAQEAWDWINQRRYR
jgi:hypothetical protein